MRVALIGLSSSQKRLARGLALGFGLLGLFWAGLMWWLFDSQASELQFVERAEYLADLRVHVAHCRIIAMDERPL